MNVMREAFRQCYPPDRDLPPAISAALARLAALEADAARDAVTPNDSRVTPTASLREPQFA